MSTPAALPQIDETLLATTRYLEALTQLDDESVRRPSVLPGWTRAHVVAHLSRNADAFARVLAQVAAGEPATMYPSSESRDADIEETVRTHDLAALADDATRSTARLTEALWSCTADPGAPYTRVPGGDESFALHTIGPRRRAEVEIHHADLDVGYDPSGWPTDFSRAVVTQRRAELLAAPEDCPAMRLTATDTDGLWTFGDGPGPEVRGTLGNLAWWLVGRGGHGLTCSTGALPTLGRWR